MKCPLCKLEGRISAMRYVVENDTTADLETKLYAEQDIMCVNSKCPNHDKVFETIRIPMELGENS